MTKTMKSKNRNFAAVIHDGEVDVTASHPVAKQLFFGWGSDRNSVDASYYGREDRSDTWGGNPDYKRWKWTLSREGVETMIRHIADNIGDRDLFPKGEVKKAMELLAFLQQIEKKL